MIYVIGSGPSGVACAKTLLRHGGNVTMLDVGLDLEDERRGIVEKVRNQKRSEWNNDLLSTYKAELSASLGGVKYKTIYGSLYPYRDVSPYPSSSKNFLAGPSYAKGGFSTLWGASLRIYQAQDLLGWPITIDDLAPYYKEILSFLPISSSLEVQRILKKTSAVPMEDLKVSRQIDSLIRDTSPFFKEIENEGGVFDSSKLAIRAQKDGATGCVYCALCMYGCPYGHIFNSAAVVKEMQKNEKFNYRPGVFVESLCENAVETQIKIRNLLSGKKEILSAKKVFLGAGVYSTARILLQSYEMLDRPLICHDSQYFLLPLIRSKRTTGISEDDTYTLSQLCLTLNNANGLTRSALQIYGYNDLYDSVFRQMTGFLFPTLRNFLRPILERLFLAQGYLHSDNSATINISLKRHPVSEYELTLEGINNKNTSLEMRKILKQFSRISRKMGMTPITPGLSITPPGRGYHSGGTFPMRSTPKLCESDLLGRPYSFKRVHVIDASVFPTIPPGPITINIMANAARIADISLNNGE